MSGEGVRLAESDVRAAVRDARRIVVKIGSSSLGAETGGLDEEKLNRLVDALASFHDAGRDVVLVTSGAIAAGLEPLGLRCRPRDLAHQQAAAAVGQGILMQHYADRFHARGILAAQLLLTVEDVTRQESYANALRSLGTLLKMGAIPVVNENDAVATHEIRFGDNDRLAALVAQLVRADALVLLSDVESLHTAHPDEPGSEPISHVADVEELTVDTHRVGSAVGTGGMTTKLQAARIATAAGIPVVLADAARIAEVLGGQPTGTTFSPIDRRRPRRLLWLAHASVARGNLHVDRGAVKALAEGHASLLAAGIRRIEGTFDAGDPVDIVTPDGEAIARGLVSFSSDDLPSMLGRRSREMADDLGVGFERAVVHRDVMVALDHSL